MTLRVMLVDQSYERAAMLEQTLRELGHDVVARLEDEKDLLTWVQRIEPDLILIDMTLPDRDILESMHTLSQTAPRLVVMYADDSDTELIEQAMRAGVSAYIADGLEPRRLKPIIEVAVARFREFQALRNELAETRSKLTDRKDIDRAKGILMRHRELSEAEAYAALRKMAMNRNQRLGEVARTIIAAAELLD